MSAAFESDELVPAEVAESGDALSREHTESVDGLPLLKWYSVNVQGNGEVAVLAEDESTAGKLATLCYQRPIGKVGIRKSRPNHGDRMLRQQPCGAEYSADDNSKDAREYRRRDGLNYCVN